MEQKQELSRENLLVYIKNHYSGNAFTKYFYKPPSLVTEGNTWISALPQGRLSEANAGSLKQRLLLGLQNQTVDSKDLDDFFNILNRFDFPAVTVNQESKTTFLEQALCSERVALALEAIKELTGLSLKSNAAFEHTLSALFIGISYYWRSELNLSSLLSYVLSSHLINQSGLHAYASNKIGISMETVKWTMICGIQIGLDFLTGSRGAFTCSFVLGSLSETLSKHLFDLLSYVPAVNRRKVNYPTTFKLLENTTRDVGFWLGAAAGRNLHTAALDYLDAKPRQQFHQQTHKEQKQQQQQEPKSKPKRQASPNSNAQSTVLLSKRHQTLLIDSVNCHREQRECCIAAKTMLKFDKSATLTDPQIRRQHRKTALFFHPDKCKADTKVCKQQITLVNLARDTIKAHPAMKSDCMQLK